MKKFSIAFWFSASVLIFLTMLPRFVFGFDAEESDFALLNKRLTDLMRDPWAALSFARFLAIIYCFYVMARCAATEFRSTSSRATPWEKRGEVKIYGDAPWSRTKIATLLVVSLGLTLSLASMLSLWVGLAAYTFLLLGSLCGTGFRLIVDDIGVDWNGLLFTWDHIESWSRRHVPANEDPDVGHGEIWYLTVRLIGNQTLECEDSTGIFAQPFIKHAKDRRLDSQIVRREHRA